MEELYKILDMVDWKQDFFRDMYGDNIYGITKDGTIVYSDNKKISDRVYYTYLTKEEPVKE
tara:strand:- start:969 stop:1151 length:183 start_codon:yes stop_codon:yes gene_type:complete